MRSLFVNALRMTGPHTAMARYIQAVARRWSRMSVPFDRIVLLAPEPFEIEGLERDTPVLVEAFGSRAPRAFFEQVLLPRRARRGAVLFCPAYTGPVLYRRPLVVANHGIYDALPGEFSGFRHRSTRYLQARSARRAHSVIANSLNTRGDLLRYYRVQERRLEVVYPAADDLFFERHDPTEVDREIVRVFGRKVPYVIFVGKLARRRNVPNLIEAMSVVRRNQRLPHHLLIVGPNTTGVDVAAVARVHGIEDAVTFLPHLEHAPLARLYAGADAFALPTTYEGISYTMFEAMASGTAVLTVDHPTLQEGAGDAALAMPSPSVKHLTDGLVALLEDPQLRRSYSERGRARARRFSWDTVAEETMKVLDRVAALSDDESPR